MIEYFSSNRMDSGATVTKVEPLDGGRADTAMNISGGDLAMNGTDANSLQELTGLVRAEFVT